MKKIALLVSLLLILSVSLTEARVHRDGRNGGYSGHGRKHGRTLPFPFPFPIPFPFPMPRSPYPPPSYPANSYVQIVIMNGLAYDIEVRGPRGRVYLLRPGDQVSFVAAHGEILTGVVLDWNIIIGTIKYQVFVQYGARSSQVWHITNYALLYR